MINDANSEIKIDLTLNPINYPNKFKKIYERNLQKLRKPFVFWLGKISIKESSNIDWWVLNHVSRDSSKSKLFHYYSLLESLKEFSKNDKKKEEIIVDKFTYYQLLDNSILKNRFKSFIALNEKKPKKNILNFLKFFTSSILIFIFIKFLKKKRKFNRSLTLIDTFITGPNLEKNNIYGKKFISLIKSKDSHFFVPTLVYLGPYKKYQTIKELIKNKKFLFKEEYLRFSDLLYSFGIFFRIKKFKKNFTKISCWNLSEIVNKEISSTDSLDSIITGLINFRFSKRLSEEKVKVKKTINWFENQNLDKGWNLGFSRYYKDAESVGYQGFTYLPDCMHTHPANYEFKAEIIPKKIIVIGSAYKKLRKEFCSALDVVVGPALRFNSQFKHKKKKKYEVLFVLSGFKVYDEILLSKAINIANQNSKFKIFIKFHPILPRLKIMNSTNIPYNLIEVSNNLQNIFQKSELVVSSGPTSAILESLLYDCRLIIFKISIYEKLLVNRLNLPKHIYKICYDDSELSDLIYKHFKRDKKLKKLNYKKLNSLKKRLFEPVNNNFLAL